MDWLIRNWYTVLSIGLGLVGIPALIMTKKSVRTKSAYCCVDSTNIISDSAMQYESIDVLYDGRSIENLTSTNITIWNNGSDVVDHRDIAAKDPIRVTPMNGTKILAAKITLTNNETNGFQCKRVGDSHTLCFDYFAKGEGAVVQVLHTGKSGADLRLSGTIKGGKLVVNRPDVRKRIAPARILGTALLGIMYAAVCILLVNGFVSGNRWLDYEGAWVNDMKGHIYKMNAEIGEAKRQHLAHTRESQQRDSCVAMIHQCRANIESDEAAIAATERDYLILKYTLSGVLLALMGFPGYRVLYRLNAPSTAPIPASLDEG